MSVRRFDLEDPDGSAFFVDRGDGTYMHFEEHARAIKALKKEIKEGLELAYSQWHVEELAGNIVKEEFWKGEIAAYHRMKVIVNEGVA